MQTYLTKIRNSMIHDGNNISFQFMNKACGVSSTVNDGVFHFTSWFGDSTKEYSDVDDALFDDFFGGQSVADLANNRSVRVAFH